MASNPFDDPPDYGTVSGQSTGFKKDEFSRRHQKVAAGVQEIKTLTRSLRRLTDQLGTSSDSDALRKRIQTAKRSAISEVESTQAGLQELLRGADQQEQRLSTTSLYRQLKQAANECEEAIQALKCKVEQFPAPPLKESKGYLVSPSHLPIAAVVHYLSNRASLLQDSGEVHMTEDRAHLLRTAVSMQQEFVVSSEAVETEARAHTMQELEEDILGLHTVMQDLGVMVQSQGEVVDNLEANVERASSGVVHGNEQLGRAVIYKKCSRKLCCVISTILITIFLLIVLAIIIVAVVLNKGSGSRK